MALVIWLLGTAAGAAGFYHPDDVARHCGLFESASGTIATAFEDRNQQAEGLSGALRRYRVALDLLGERAPSHELERVATLEQEYGRQRAVLQEFADTVLQDFDGAFTAGVERALAALGTDAVQCEGQIPVGPRVPGMGGRTKPNPDCVGDDLNTAIAGKLDADPALRTAVEAIAGRDWPTLSVAAEPQPLIGEGAQAIDVWRLMTGAAKSELLRIDTDDDRARLPFQAAIEQGADSAALAALVEQARQVSTDTAAKRAALAAPVLAAAEGAMDRWDADAGWCANPKQLGGCTQADATSELLPRLLEDKKLRKALPR